jgi:integrase
LGVGTVQPYLSKQDGKRAGWRAMWRDHDGKQRSKSFDRKSDAQKHLSTIEADLLRGTYVDPRAGQVTLAEFAEDWMTKQEWRPATRTLADSHMRNHIGPGLGTRPLLSITRTDVQGFVTGMSRGDDALSPTTIDGVYRRLVSILEAAVYDRKIARSPAVKIKLPKVNKTVADSVVALDLDDVHRIAEAAPPWMTAFVWTIATAGLRPGEAAGLTLERVDFMRREIHVDRQLTTIVRDVEDTPAGETRTTAVLAPTKTASSVRRIPIADSLVTELNRHLADCPQYEIEPGATLLFTNSKGAPLRRNTMGDTWDRLRTKLDLPPAARGWHSLRHTYASWLIEAGLSVKTVQARLGHASATETLEVYSHLWPDSDDDTRAAIERRLQISPAPPQALNIKVT